MRFFITLLTAFTLTLGLGAPVQSAAPNPSSQKGSLLEQNLLSAYSQGTTSQPTQSSEARSYISTDVDLNDSIQLGKIFTRNDVAVIIGIEEYLSLPSVEFAYNDSRLIKEYLVRLGMEERNIRYIKNNLATQSAFKVAIENWLPDVVNRSSKVLVYFSGHGAPEPTTGSAYLVPYDGDPSYLEDTSYSTSRLYAQLARLDVAQVNVMLDSCFSGLGERSVIAEGTRAITIQRKTPTLDPKMAVLSAASDKQISTSYPEKGHGVFTYFVLKALKDGAQDLHEIYLASKDEITNTARRKNVDQTPVYLGKGG